MYLKHAFPLYVASTLLQYILQTHFAHKPVSGKYTNIPCKYMLKVESLFVHGAQQTGSDKSCSFARGLVDKSIISFQGIANPKPDDPKIPVEVV